MNPELPVTVFEVLAHRLRRDPQQRGDLGVRSTFGDSAKNLALPRSESVDSVQRRSRLVPPACRALTQPLEIREQEIEYGTVTLAEIRIGPVEFQACATRAGRVEPQAHHVLDPERGVDVLIELEPVVLAAGKEVGVLPRPGGRPNWILVRITPVRIAYLLSHLASWLTGEDDGWRPGSEFLVVSNDVARHEPTERVEHRLGTRNRPIDNAGFREYIEHVAIVGRGEPRHGQKDTTNVVWLE